ncbi:MAG TPA: glucan biosynthesis protein G [bacterium]|nr:glucan biosynthesis protein G [bacterium]
MFRPFGWLILIGSLLTATVGVAAESAEVNLDYVAKRALERAKEPFHSPRADLPKVLRQDNLDYDKYREIRFRRDRALWGAEKLPFCIEFFHPGYLYQEPVHVNEFTPTHTQPIRFVQDFFDYGQLDIANQIPAKTGYAGFRVLYPLNQANQLDELGAFLGASYFRLLGKNLRYGESARGLALDSGEGDRGEEFPIFTDWWLGKPNPGDSELRLYAILDSVSCAGAYEFFIKPGVTTTASIKAVLYFRETNTIAAVDKNRKPIKTIGLAPLTSMFWFGKDTERKFDDYRTEVHDSDGLLVHMGNGEIFWRPLDNPATTRHQVFHAPNIKGFGLLQRERNFAAYQDMFNLYHQVPSVWVEPDGNWGDGDLHLVELSTSYEGLDNIVAFWDPKDKPAPLQPFRFGYTLHWEGGEADVKRSENRVVATRIGPDAQFGGRQFVLDFKGPKFDRLAKDNPPTAIASCSGGARIVDTLVLRNPFLGTWRVILKMVPKPDSHAAVDLRCTLQQGTNVIGETWTYQWSPP